MQKDHPKLEAYGTIDELNSHLGLIQSIIPDPGEKIRLTKIQNHVFAISSNLAMDNKELPNIIEEDIVDLEKAMDMLQDHIPPLTNFILPAGHPSVAYCHIARTVCRRAERQMVALSHEATVEPIVISTIIFDIYLNLFDIILYYFY